MIPIDCIAQVNKDGTIEPRRVRFELDNEIHTYTISEFQKIRHGTETVDSIFVKEVDPVWKCKVDQAWITIVWDGKRFMMSG